MNAATARPLTISERIRRQDAPTLPPAKSYAYCLKDACRFALSSSAAECVDRVGMLLAVEEMFGSHEIVIVTERSRIADLYRYVVQDTREGGVWHEEHIRSAPWCEACECLGHGTLECESDECDAPETEAEQLGLGLGGR
jgi:hypothetical protein